MINIVTLDIREAMDIASLLYKAKFFNSSFTIRDYKEIVKYHDLLVKKIYDAQLNRNE